MNLVKKIRADDKQFPLIQQQQQESEFYNEFEIDNSIY